MATAAAKKDKEANPNLDISNITLRKCVGEKVDEQLNKLELDANGSLKARVTRLQEYYKSKSAEIDIVRCDNCGGDSGADLTSCPYCGDEGAVGEEEGAPTETDEIEADSAEVQTDGDPAVEIVEDQEEGDSMDKGGKGKGSKGKGAKGKKDATVTSLASARAKKSAPSPESTGTTMVVHSSEALDEQVQNIRGAVSEGALAMHRMGAAAQAIVDGDLWKQRVDGEGVPLFRSFKSFCKQELGLTAVHVYRSMEVAKEFTPEDIKNLSGKQVRVLLDVPREKREELTEHARGGEGAGKLTERANELRGKKPKELPEPKKSISVAITPGITKLKMFVKPNTGSAKVGDTETSKRAKRLADGPWAVMDMPNKVRGFFRIVQDKDGQLILVVEYRRGEQVI